MTMLLAQAGPTSNRFELLERIGGWEKIIAWAQARQYEEIAQFVASAEAAPAGLTRCRRWSPAKPKSG